MSEINKIYTSKDKRLWICKKFNCKNPEEHCDIFKILVNQSSFRSCGDLKRNLFPNSHSYPKCDCSSGIIIMKLLGGI